MERFVGITVKRVAAFRCLDGHVKEPYEMYMALGARPYIQLLLRSACTVGTVGEVVEFEIISASFSSEGFISLGKNASSGMMSRLKG